MLLDGEDGDDVRVVERGDGPGFPSEARQTVGVSREGIGKNLQRNIAIQFRVAGAVDLTHATSAEQGQNLVGAELPSDQRRGRVFSHHLRRYFEGGCREKARRCAPRAATRWRRAADRGS